jgi:hypothetical protein
MKRQLDHSTLIMADHYASLSVEPLDHMKSIPPLRADSIGKTEGYGSGYWNV